MNCKDDPLKRAERLAEVRWAQLEAKRAAAKQVQADEWNALFKKLELPIIAQVQIAMWQISQDPELQGPHPEIWIEAEEGEKSWSMLVECLKKL